MTAPTHRVLEGLRTIRRNFQPAALVRAKIVSREQEARFLLDMVDDAVTIIEQVERRDD